MLESKITDLLKHSLDAFSNKNITNVHISIRKCVEAFCWVIIHYHLGEEAGGERSAKKPVYLHELIDRITHHGHGILKHKARREFTRRHLKILAFYGNASAHDYDNPINMNHDDVKIAQLIMTRLLYWLFTDYLPPKIGVPDQLKTYIEKYDIFISFNNADKKWIKTLIKNLQLRGYKVFSQKIDLIGGENYEQKIQHAIDSAHTGILIYTSSRSDFKWFLKEYHWMQKRKNEYSKFKIIPTSINSTNNPIADIHPVEFNYENYHRSFGNLLKSIERKPADSLIDIDDHTIQLPSFATAKCLGMRKKFCTVIMSIIILLLLSSLSFLFLDSDKNTQQKPQPSPTNTDKLIQKDWSTYI